MIVTKKKDINKVLENLKDDKKIFIIGCGQCSTICKTGGEKEVLEMKKILEQNGKKITGFAVPEAPCLAPEAIMLMRKNKDAISEADAILNLSCGLGSQSINDHLLIDKMIHVGCDTLFMGQVGKNGVLLERCSGCGDCMLEITASLCPMTRCPKGMVNGPCGGQDKGKCEVDRENDCVWILIYEKLKKRNQLDKIKKIQEPKDHSISLKPRTIKV